MNEEWRNELVTKGAAVDALKDNMFRLTLAEEQGCEGHVVWHENVVSADVLERALLALPSAQPEIIRCGDCMHNGSFDTDCPIYWPGKEFCNFGERKDDE